MTTEFQCSPTLPTDVLDKVFEMLLPDLRNIPWPRKDLTPGQLRWPLRGSMAPFHIAQPHALLNYGCIASCDPGSPVDLMHCRLTCRVFNLVGIRWLWRRLTLRAQDHKPKDSIRMDEICEFLEDHPEIGAHIRFLTLIIDSGRTWPRILPLLANLKVLDLTIRSRGTRFIAPDILHDLLSRPSLHTVVFQGEGHPFRSPLPIHTIKNLWMLYEPSTYDTPIDWSLIPSLESLYYDGRVGADDYCGNMLVKNIPWHSLKQLSTFISSEGLPMLAESFKSWRASEPSRCSPLSELSIFGSTRDSNRIEIILNTFGGQVLTKLVLRGIPEITAPILDGIVITFPRLLELTVHACGDSSLMNWDGSLIEYAFVLGRLEYLKFLEWNYTTPYAHDDQAIPSCVQMLRTISDHCSNLIRVNFTPTPGDHGGSTYRFLLMKDKNSADNGVIVLSVDGDPDDDMNRSYGDSYYAAHRNATTAWSFSNYTDV